MKNKNNSIAAVFLAGVAILVPSMACADTSNFYTAFDIGRSHAKEACNGVPATLACDDADTAYRLAGGYLFTPAWGAEVSYTHLGKITAKGSYSSIPASAEARLKSFQLAGSGILPASGAFSVTGKLGLARAQIKVSASTAIPGFNAVLSSREASTKVAYGIGVQYDFNKNVSARAQYENLGKAGDEATTGASQLSLLSAGLSLRF